MDLEKIKRNIVKGAPARLFPVLPDSRKEEKATSMLLAVFSVVPDFAKEILGEAGAPSGKRANLTCFTEVSFKGANQKSRPDGLIVMQNAGKSWAALVETKVGRSSLTAEQIEEYLTIAREQGFDAVITISNQFAALPSHHPVEVSRNKIRSVDLYHFSWMTIFSKALLLMENKGVEDVEQAFLLRELVRYLKHDSSGISTPFKISREWREVCDQIQVGQKLRRTHDVVRGAVSDWFQLLRFLSIQLSLATGETCSLAVSRKHSAKPETLLGESTAEFVAAHYFAAEIDVPNAASNVRLNLNLARRVLELSATLKSPQDVKQQRTGISFVLNQLRGYEKDDLTIRVNWPRRTKSTELSISKCQDEDDRKALLSSATKDLPTSVDIIRRLDLGPNIKSASKLPNIVEDALKSFYKDVVQDLKQYVPKAPKLKPKAASQREPKADVAVADDLQGIKSITAGETSIFSSLYLPVSRKD